MSPPQAAERQSASARSCVDQHVRRTGHGRAALTSLVLRSLKQARYARNLGHAGLGLAHYCHFTSPIRRYPDLVCHRALLSAVGGGGGRRRAPSRWARRRGVDVGARARRDVDRARRRRRRPLLPARARAVRGTAGTAVFEGEVVGLIGAGAFVAFGERATRACCPCAACAATGGSSTSRARSSIGHAQRRRDPPRRPGHRRASDSRRRAARPRRPRCRLDCSRTS